MVSNRDKSARQVLGECAAGSPGPLLCSACCASISQCLDVLSVLEVKDYRHCSEGHSSIGVHIRHIIERMQCLLDGLDSGRVDYDRRPRDQRLENNPAQAAETLLAIRERLASVQVSGSISLQVLESVHQDAAALAVSSSLDRELMSLVFHTIHHLAIVALLARACGVKLAAEIGKAPATLRYERAAGEHF